MTSFPCLVVKPPSLDPVFRMLEANLFLLPVTNSQDKLAYASLNRLKRRSSKPTKETKLTY